MENPTHTFSNANLVLKLMKESQIKTVMSWGLQKKITAFS